MAQHPDGCERCRSLLARMDDAAARGHGDDPSAVLGEGDRAWLATHLESCAVCAPDAALVASLGTLLGDDPTDAADDAFFAARRASLLDAIRASGAEAAAEDGGVVGGGAPARAATRPVLRAVPGTGARGGRGPRPARRRSLWRPLLPALAAALAIVVALGMLLSRGPRPDGGDVDVVEVASGDLVAPVDADAADDSWVVASGDLFEVVLSSTSDPALDELSEDDLEEVEGVFVPSPGWS